MKRKEKEKKGVPDPRYAPQGSNHPVKHQGLSSRVIACNSKIYRGSRQSLVICCSNRKVLVYVHICREGVIHSNLLSVIIPVRVINCKMFVSKGC